MHIENSLPELGRLVRGEYVVLVQTASASRFRACFRSNTIILYSHRSPSLIQHYL